MCIVIEADCILANLFAGGRNRVSLRDLKELQSKLEKSIPELVVDVSMENICYAVDQRPDMFSWCDDVVLCTPENADKNLFSVQYVERHFNCKIPEDVKKELLGVVA
jgi:hypothetical protein